MFLEGELWERSCDNAFADNIAFFAAGIELLTGFVPVYIEDHNGATIQNHRKDIFGLIHPSTNTPAPSLTRKIIPIYPA